MASEPPLIIVADHDRAYLELMQELLTEEGYAVQLAPPHEAAYPLIRSVQPDLVILDMRFGHPDSALLALDMMRLDPATTHIPILLCSTSLQVFPERIAHLKAMGCDTIAKPFRLEEMLAKVGRLLDGPPTP